MEITRRAMLVAGGGAVAGSSAFAAQLGSSGPLGKAIELAATRAIAADGCPGVQVAVSAHGHVRFSKGFGLANLETSSTVSPRTVFRIGSLTKQFTAAAVIKLASEGKLSVADALSDHLPAFRRIPSLTLLELMNHTAGLHDNAEDVSCSATVGSQKSQVQLAEEIAAQPKPLDFPPGSAWLYSNANYIALGAVIEQVTGQPFSDALAGLIFRPLALANTAVDHSQDVVKGRASGYTPGKVGSQQFANADYIPISDAGGAGAMRSMATDLTSWHNALLGGRLFDFQHVAFMTAPGRLRDGRLSGANRFSPQDANYGDVQYACGLLVSSGPNGRVISHNGFINGFSAVLESYVDRGVTFAVLCNADVNPGLPFRSLRRAVAERLLS